MMLSSWKWVVALMMPLIYSVNARIFRGSDDGQDRFLFDLDNDPNENTNLYGLSDYDDVVTSIEERASYWAGLIKDPELPDKTHQHSTFKKCDCIVPWIGSQTAPSSVEQIYFNDEDSPPDIVFVFVDDWGYNDVGYRSTYLPWTTPTIDKLAAEGIKLENFYSHETCSPSRGALLTGRYALRLGMWEQHEEAELPINETTLPEELKSAGYKTYMVGKWHLGYSTTVHLPQNRGFDSFYGYYNGYVDYWNKTYSTYLDLQDNDGLVTDEAEISSDLHNGYLLQSKVEAAIADHVTNYSDQPMFLYYAMQLIHGVWAAPDTYLDRCADPTSVDDDYVASVEYKYCAMNVMMDEAIANLTCTLKALNRYENAIMLIVSDNGGEGTNPGNSYPFKGHKGSYFRGGVSTTAIIHSPLLPVETRGTSYDGLMHLTDWLPTIMGLATLGQWNGSLSGAELDGYDMWGVILNNASSPRLEVVHYVDTDDNLAIVYNGMKYMRGIIDTPADQPNFNFTEDQDPDAARFQCSDPSLDYDDDSVDEETMFSEDKRGKKTLSLSSSSASTLRSVSTSTLDSDSSSSSSSSVSPLSSQVSVRSASGSALESEAAEVSVSDSSVQWASMSVLVGLTALVILVFFGPMSLCRRKAQGGDETARGWLERRCVKTDYQGRDDGSSYATSATGLGSASEDTATESTPLRP